MILLFGLQRVNWVSLSLMCIRGFCGVLSCWGLYRPRVGRPYQGLEWVECIVLGGVGLRPFVAMPGFYLILYVMKFCFICVKKEEDICVKLMAWPQMHLLML